MPYFDQFRVDSSSKGPWAAEPCLVANNATTTTLQGTAEGTGATPLQQRDMTVKGSQLTTPRKQWRQTMDVSSQNASLLSLSDLCAPIVGTLTWNGPWQVAVKLAMRCGRQAVQGLEP